MADQGWLQLLHRPKRRLPRLSELSRPLSLLPKPPILRLPDEILLNIFSHFAEHAWEMVLYGRPESSNQHKRQAAQQGVRDLCAVALSCRRFKSIAQEVMLQSPVLEADKIVHWHRRLIALIVTLLKNPAYKGKVRSLRIEVGRQPGFIDYLDHYQQTSFSPWFLKTCDDIIQSTPLSANARAHWKLALGQGKQLAFVGILLALLPNLEALVLYPNEDEHISPKLAELFGVSVDHMPQLVQGISGLRNLEYLKLLHGYPTKGIDTLHTLRTLDLSFSAYEHWSLSVSYPGLTKLRFSTNFMSIRAPSRNGTDTHFLQLAKRILTHVPNLRGFHLYDETSYSKNIDYLPAELRRPRPVLFDYILWPLYASHPAIKEISLPESWYRGSGVGGQVIRSMPAFTNLRAFTLPECAVTGSARGMPHFNTMASEHLPSTLEFLRVSCAGPSKMHWNIRQLSEWLSNIFDARALDNLKEIQIYVPTGKQFWADMMYEVYFRVMKASAGNRGVRLTVEFVDGVKVCGPRKMSFMDALNEVA